MQCCGSLYCNDCYFPISLWAASCHYHPASHLVGELGEVFCEGHVAKCESDHSAVCGANVLSNIPSQHGAQV